jgi:hypothetical protein
VLKILSAPIDRTFVQLKTPFWLAPGPGGRSPWRKIKATASVGGGTSGVALQTVTAIATPHVVKWEFGDDKDLNCYGPGKVKGEGAGVDCSHTYARSSAHVEGTEKYTVTASLAWTVAWTCVGACTQAAGVLADHIEVGNAELEVGEIQTESQ